MSWYAVDALDRALSETKELLLPFDLGTWVRLAVITAFAGLSAPQTPTFSWESSPNAAVETAREVSFSEFLAVFAVVAVAVLLVGLVVAVIGAVMEFVLVDAVRSRDVRILGPFRERLGVGLRLFGFRLAVILAVLVAVAGVLAPVGLAVAFDAPLALLALLVTLPLLLVVGFVAALVSEFTTAFVVPLVAEEGGGIVATWREFWPQVRADWKQFAVYALVKAVLLFAASVVFGFAVAVVAVPLGLFGILAGALSGAALVAVAVAAVVGLVVVGAVSVPVVTFLRYHSLCTLDAAEVPFSLR
ncbi:DUF7544 domain-containing protein [Halobacterium litoreum]|uniref:Membrane domain of glycerophosphoryl diester phosphodiesterase n=1 Tax=Halobacterium litoreum TaxID=2039234 RepID=A0ABD5NAK6_9EURY|nr:hypothetical protein [Halobacterium litoreum]UHH12003.1 hypothetical protein LT972_07515 [Halobacterium litoreum]